MKKIYIVVCCFKTWQHYLRMHKIKVLTINVSLKYFEMQPRASTKQLRWHDTIVLLNVELKHKLRWDNVVLDVLNQPRLKH